MTNDEHQRLEIGDIVTNRSSEESYGREPGYWRVDASNKFKKSDPSYELFYRMTILSGDDGWCNFHLYANNCSHLTVVSREINPEFYL